MTAPYFPENQSSERQRTEPSQSPIAPFQSQPIHGEARITGTPSNSADEPALVRWAMRGSVIAGLLVALLGIPQGYFAVISYMKPPSPANTSSPKPDIVPLGSPHNLKLDVGEMAIFYDPNQRLAKLKIDFRAAEYGNEDNELLPDAAWMKTRSQPQTAEVRLDGDIRLSEDTYWVEKPVIPHKAAPKKMQCWIALGSGEHTQKFIQEAGVRCLVVELRDIANKPYRLSFCFNLTKSAIRDLYKRGHKKYLSKDQLL
jgi:hypothetical protein